MAYSPGEIYDSERAKIGKFENFISYESWLEYQYAEMLDILVLTKAMAECNGWSKSDISRSTYQALISTINKMSEL